MAVSPLALKIIAGLSGVSVVGVGSYLYLSKTAGIDDLAFDEKTKTSFLDWEVKLISPSDASITSTSSGPMSVSVSVIGTEKESKNPRTWTCNLKGTITSPTTGKAIDVKGQIETTFGINSTNKSFGDATKFEKFFKNCKKHRKISPNKSSTSEINLGEITLPSGDGSDNKYKFETTKFQKLYEGEIPSLDEVLKEWEIKECKDGDGCDLQENALKKIKFSGKTATELGTHKSSKLKIEETDETNIFPERLKFIFSPAQKLEIKGSSSDSSPIVIEKDANTEFKLKESWTGDYSLEKAWDVTKLAEKAGLTCPKDSSDSECNINTGQKINVFKDGGNYVIGATFSDVGNKKITFTKDQENHNQGFKFTVSESNISLGSTQDKKVGNVTGLVKENTSYEIKPHSLSGGEKVWFLTEVKTSTGK